MVYKCAVHTCFNRFGTLHRFPNPEKDETRFNEWVLRCNNQKLNGLLKDRIFKSYRVCGAHFLRSDFAANHCIGKTAIPSQHVYIPLTLPSKDNQQPTTTKDAVENDIAPGNYEYVLVDDHSTMLENKLQNPLPNDQFNNICITCNNKLDQTEQFSIHELIPRIHPPITFFEGLKQLITNYAQFSITQVPQSACDTCLINTVGFLRFQTICNKSVDSIKSYEIQNPVPYNKLNNFCIICKEQIDQDQTEQLSIHQHLPLFNPPITFFEGLKQLLTNFAQFSINQVPQNACHSCLINTVGFLRFQTVCNQTVESMKSYIKEQESTSSALLKESPTSSVVHDGLADNDLDTSDEDSNDIDDEESGAKEQSTENEEKQQNEDEECVPLSVLKKRYNTRPSNEIAINDDKRECRGDRPHQCSVCCKTFSTRSKLKIHAVVHKDELDHICSECGKGFKGDHLLKSHINRMHRERPSKTCEICGEVLKNSDVYDVHKIKVHDTGHECELCGRKFFNINHLKRHIASHTGIQRFECTFCGKKFRQKHGKKTHEASYCKVRIAETQVVGAGSVATQPSTEGAQEEQGDKEKSNAQKGEGEHQGERPFLCSVCGKRFCTKSNLNVHLAVHNDTLDYTCPEPECGRKFKGRPYLNYHIKSVHRDRPTKKCDICGQVFTNDDAYSAYGMHKVKMHGKEHECDQCGKKYHKIGLLRAHIDSHNGIKRFECADCGMKFARKQGKFEHEARYCKVRKAETPINGEAEESDEIERRRACKRETNLAWGKKLVPCEHCQKSVRRDKLRAHERLHREDKPFACTVCGRTFRLRSTHYAHMQLHKETFDYLCSECGKGFKSSMHLGTHRRTVHRKRIPKTCEICGKVSTNAATHNLHMEMHGEKKFECELCDKKFYHISSLKRHSATHTDRCKVILKCEAQINMDEHDDDEDVSLT